MNLAGNVVISGYSQYSWHIGSSSLEKQLLSPKPQPKKKVCRTGTSKTKLSGWYVIIFPLGLAIQIVKVTQPIGGISF